MIKRAGKTQYIQHYVKLEQLYKSPHNAFKTLNKTYYDDLINSVINCKAEQTKLIIYKSIYNICTIMECESISLTTEKEEQRKLISKYILSSHKLASETGKWRDSDRNCKKCNEDVSENLEHFLFNCNAYSSIRERYESYPSDLKSFFKWEFRSELLELLHNQREK